MSKRLGLLVGMMLVGLCVNACGSSGSAGPTGPAGASGQTGATGATGTAGTAGSSGAIGTPGPTGPSGGAGDASVLPAAFGIVSPRNGLLGTEGDYIVTAADTTLTSSATLDFGTGVTTSNVAAVSTGSLSVHLKIADTAPIGAHDVKITQGHATITGTGAFLVGPDVTITPIAPSSSVTIAQGALEFAQLTNMDPFQAWDPTYFGFGSNCLSVISTGLGGADTTSSNAYIAVLADPSAAVGACGFDVGNTNASGVVLTSESSDPAALTITATTPTVLDPKAASPTSGTITAAGGTQVYSVASTGTSIVEITTTGTGTTISPATVAFPPTGSFLQFSEFTDSLFYGPQPAPPIVFGTTAAATNSVVVFDEAYGGGSAADYGYTIGATVTDATLVSPTGPCTETTPCSLASHNGAPLVITGTLTQPAEIQVYSFTANVGDTWLFSYQESPNSVVVVETNISALTTGYTDGCAIGIVQPAAPSIVGSNALTMAPVPASGGDGGIYCGPGTYLIAVYNIYGTSAPAPYTFTMMNTAPATGGTH